MPTRCGCIVALAGPRRRKRNEYYSSDSPRSSARAKPMPEPLGTGLLRYEGNRTVVGPLVGHPHCTGRGSERKNRPTRGANAQALFKQARQRNDMRRLPRSTRELFAIKVRQSGWRLMLALATGLEHWPGERLGSVWVSDDGHIRNRRWPRAWPVWSSLMFDYPLAGTFEFSIDAYLGPWQDGPVSFAGLVLQSARRPHHRPARRTRDVAGANP